MENAIDRTECGVFQGWGDDGVGRDFQEEDSEGGEWSGVEEGGGEGGFRGGEEFGELLEDGHLVDEFVDVGDVGGGGQADAGEEGVAV